MWCSNFILFVCLFVFCFYFVFIVFFFSFVFFCNCYGIQNKPHEGFFRLILAFYLSLIVSFYVLVDFGCPLSPKGFESNKSTNTESYGFMVQLAQEKRWWL